MAPINLSRRAFLASIAALPIAAAALTTTAAPPAAKCAIGTYDGIARSTYAWWRQQSVTSDPMRAVGLSTYHLEQLRKLVGELAALRTSGRSWS